MSTPAPYIAVMDADLQHDETILPRMLEKLKAEKLDLVVATRNAEGGSMGEFAASRLLRLSHFGRRLSNAISRCDLSDPMSGFFILDRRFLEEMFGRSRRSGSRSSRIVAWSPGPFVWERCPTGSAPGCTEKVNSTSWWASSICSYCSTKRWVRLFRHLHYIRTGGCHGRTGSSSILFLLLRVANQPFLVAQGISTVVVMTLNFFLNNAITYRDRRLRGRRLVVGLSSFYLACSVGAFVNLRVGQFVVEGGGPWYLAGLAGLVVSSVWNYGVTAMFTWHEGRRAAAMTRKPPGALSASEPELPIMT